MSFFFLMMDRTTRAAPGNNSRSPAEINPIRESALKTFVWLEEIKLKHKRRTDYVILIGKYQEFQDRENSFTLETKN